MTEPPVLYSFRRCPYAMRARLALWVSGVNVELREVSLAAKPEAMLAASPKGTVPVLVLPDGTVVDESLGIMRWALRQADPYGWLARHDPALVAANDGAFKHHLDRYKYHTRYGVDPLEHRAAGMEILAGLDARLAGQANLHGLAMGLDDAALFPFVRQFANTDRAWFDAQPLPQLQDWLGRHLSSALFAVIMVKVPLWQPGAAPVRFGA